MIALLFFSLIFCAWRNPTEAASPVPWLTRRVESFQTSRVTATNELREFKAGRPRPAMDITRFRLCPQAAIR